MKSKALEHEDDRPAKVNAVGKGEMGAHFGGTLDDANREFMGGEMDINNENYNNPNVMQILQHLGPFDFA